MTEVGGAYSIKYKMTTTTIIVVVVVPCPSLLSWSLVIGRGLYLPWYNPYGIHLESMESTWNSIWNPWNGCWQRPQPISYSINIMDSMWNNHGTINPIWNGGISALDSMESSDGFHGTIPDGFHGTIPGGFHGHYTIRIHINSSRNY